MTTNNSTEDVWLTKKEFKELVKTGEVTVDSVTIKLTDYVNSRVDETALE